MGTDYAHVLADLRLFLNFLKIQGGCNVIVYKCSLYLGQVLFYAVIPFLTL
jgi:hypothetical protein